MGKQILSNPHNYVCLIDKPARPIYHARSVEQQPDKAQKALTESQQMYLKAAYLVQQDKGAARVTDIARHLGVLKASVTSALRPLVQRGLVRHARYDLITLTERGKEQAAAILERYEALRAFIVSVLGVDEETARRDACLMEHRVSDAVHARLLDFVDCYESCPRRRAWPARQDRTAAPGCDRAAPRQADSAG